MEKKKNRTRQTPEGKAHRAAVHKQRYQNDPQYRIGRRLRKNLYDILRRRPNKIDLIGCTKQFLRGYLESQFKDGMSWENYGSGWQVDHKIPLAAFDLTDEAQQMKAFHYSNLQPLWAKDNAAKGSKLLYNGNVNE